MSEELLWKRFIKILNQSNKPFRRCIFEIYELGKKDAKREKQNE